MEVSAERAAVSKTRTAGAAAASSVLRPCELLPRPGETPDASGSKTANCPDVTCQSRPRPFDAMARASHRRSRVPRRDDEPRPPKTGEVDSFPVETTESGLDSIADLRRRQADAAIIVITAFATFETAVDAIKRGAADYLPKPFTPDQVRHAARRALESVHLRRELADAQSAWNRRVRTTRPSRRPARSGRRS